MTFSGLGRVNMFVQFLISLSLFLQKFRAECAGATAIEYALIAAGIALAISAVVYTLGDEILAIFEDVEAGFAGP